MVSVVVKRVILILTGIHLIKHLFVLTTILAIDVIVVTFKLSLLIVVSIWFRFV